jgi:Tfp pilus assembly ATPase PilU
MTYCIHDLLRVVAQEGARRLLIEIGRPPVIELKGEEHVVEGPEVTKENAAHIVERLATAEQLRELDRCGDVRFIHESELARFGVTITVEQQRPTLEARNLSVPPT